MFEKLPGSVTVFEVGPRDGLQNEENFVQSADKVQLIESLAHAGLKNIEITSFVSPKWIPQLADGAEVARALKLPADVTTSALVPNLKGLEGALAAGIPEIAVFMSATETHSKRNINKSIDEALATLSEVTKAAKDKGLLVRGYLSVVFECPYEGKVKQDDVARLVESLLKMGVDEISLGDTIGAATPKQVVDLLNLLSKSMKLDQFALHFHDTRGTALANVLAGLESGITTFDSSIGGMGGCPYAPGAAGNLATEDLVYMLDGLGVKTGINLDKLVESGELAQKLVGRQLPGRYLRAALASKTARKIEV